MYISAVYIHSRDLHMGRKTCCRGREDSSLTCRIVMTRFPKPQERCYPDSDIFDSTDGASFPTIFSHPCLQMLGNSSSPLRIVINEYLTSCRVGAVLYTSYLQILGTLHHPSSQSLKRTYPPPPIYCTALAGFSAGVVQYVVFQSTLLSSDLKPES